MQARFSYGKAYPDAFKAMLALSQTVEKTGLSPQLIDLVNYRVSQLNGCAYCLDMHSKDLRARGETEQRLYMISAWRELPNLYSSRERAALAEGGHPAQGPGGSGRDLRCGVPGAQRSRIGAAYAGDCRDQWLEPFQRGLPDARGKL